MNQQPPLQLDEQLPDPTCITKGLEAQLDALLADTDFLSLQHRKDRPNLFKILGTSYTEMWHTAFLRWLLDPSSHHGLGDFPLKRFLAAVMNHGVRQEGFEAFDPKFTLADIEQADLSGTKLEAERLTERVFGKSGIPRIDLYATLGNPSETSAEAGSHDVTPLQIVIENKVRAREQVEQTSTYFTWAEQFGFKTSIYVYLTLEDTRSPEHPAFIQFYYQRLYDRVLLPVLSHPQISTEARFLVEQYMANLTDTTLDRPMAQGDRELCARIYNKHRAVFETIFMAVKEEVPAPRPTRTSQRFTVTLRDLAEAGLIAAGQRLIGRNKKDVWEADLIEQDGRLLIRSVSDPEQASPNPSRTASALVGRPMNGWVFWELKGDQADKKALADLRDEFLQRNTDIPEFTQQT